MRTITILLLALAGPLALAQTGTVNQDEKVYKWIDADGVEHYGATLPADTSNIEVLDLDDSPVSTVDGELRPAEQNQLEEIEREDRIEEQNERTPDVVIIDRSSGSEGDGSTGNAILPGNGNNPVADDNQSADDDTSLPDTSGDGIAGNDDGDQPDISAPSASQGEQPGMSAPDAANGSQPGISAPGSNGANAASSGGSSSGGSNSGGSSGGASSGGGGAGG